MPELIINGQHKRTWTPVEVAFNKVYIDTDEDDEDIFGRLSIKLTHEGIIVDLANEDGEIIATWARTANEMVEEMSI